MAQFIKRERRRERRRERARERERDAERDYFYGGSGGDDDDDSWTVADTRAYECTADLVAQGLWHEYSR